MSNRANNHAVWGQATQWLSRTLAVVLVMIVPGAVGGWLDRQLATNFIMPIGFGLGLLLAIVLLMVLAKQYTPPAGGKPLPWDDQESDQPESDEPSSERPQAEQRPRRAP